MNAEVRASGDGGMSYAEGLGQVAHAAKLHGTSRIEERVGRGFSELQHLEMHWRTLAGALPNNRFMHTFEWQCAYLQHLEANHEAIYYVSFFSNGQAIAIFPLRRHRRSVGHIAHWLWEQPTHPHLVLAEPLIAPAWATAELLRRLLKVFQRWSNLSWDALHFPNLLEDSAILQLLKANNLARVHLEVTGHSMYFPCADIDQAMANCSASFKKNLRRQGRKLSQQGTVTLHLERQGAGLDAAFDDFLRLEASGWKGGGGKASAIKLHPHLLGFYRELKERFSRVEGSLISLLKIDDVTIAAQFCLQVGDVLYIQKIAYDEAWHAEAPGNQLLYQLLEHCCQHPGIRQLSLVTAPAWAIGRWNPASEQVWEAYVFKACPRGLGGLAMRRFKTQLAWPAQALWERARRKLRASLAVTEEA